MSIVVGIKQKNKVWLACDKQVTAGDTKAFLVTPHNKIVSVPERPGIIVGSVGYLRGINLLETNNSYIDELCYYRKQIDYNYMVNAFPLLLNDLYCTHGFIVREEGKPLNFENKFLLASPESVFEIGNDGSALEIIRTAIGSGGELALGALSSYQRDDYSDKEMIEILRKAIKAASYNTGCGGGCIIMNTDSNKIYDFEELKDLKFENSLKK